MVHDDTITRPNGIRRNQSVTRYNGAMAYQRNKLLIVDGYNVLRSGSRYRALRDQADYTDDSFNIAREALINDVIAYMGRDYEDGVIVFDGGNNEFSEGKEQKVGCVRVVFSPAGVTADHVIEKLAHDARVRGQEVMVVTSDATIQDTVFGGGVDRMSSDGFSLEAEQLDDETRQDNRPRVAHKRTVADRIDAGTLAKLQALRDGTSLRSDQA